MAEGFGVGRGVDERCAGKTEGRSGRIRAAAGVVVLALALAAAGQAIERNGHSFLAGWRQVGVWPMAASFVAGVVGIGATYPVWREVLGGLGVSMPWRDGARVFFSSQLAKYLPGSVWPAVIQARAGRRRGASQRTMLAANLITIALGCTLGLLVAGLLLPLSDASALSRYWWVLLGLPLLVAMLHPRAVPGLLDRLFGLLHRQPLGVRLAPNRVVHAAGWSLLSWAAQGVHIAVLLLALGIGVGSSLVLGIGGMALAVSAGVLFVPAPAGVGIRDVALAFVLDTVLPSGQALVVVVASRVILILADLALPALAALAGSRSRRRAPLGS